MNFEDEATFQKSYEAEALTSKCPKVWLREAEVSFGPCLYDIKVVLQARYLPGVKIAMI